MVDCIAFAKAGYCFAFAIVVDYFALATTVECFAFATAVETVLDHVDLFFRLRRPSEL